jgi:2-methylisocitrate lyase-like PEP mutase family enzyme
MSTSVGSATSAGTRLRNAIRERDITPFIGVYDAFSASVAGKHFDTLFISGFGFAASFYGLPDIGFIAWSDMVSYVQRIRTILPSHHLLVDIDDGYSDPEVACHVVSLLENSGVSGVVLEDQRRPRRCGHFEGKQILELDEYLTKLQKVLNARRDLFVVARTDSSDASDVQRRARAFGEAGADAVLADSIKDLDALRELRASVKGPLCFNQIAGGKSPFCTLTELREAGANIAIYSTPCLFPAQAAIEDAMADLQANDGSLANSRIGLKECSQLLADNLDRRGKQ